MLPYTFWVGCWAVGFFLLVFTRLVGPLERWAMIGPLGHQNADHSFKYIYFLVP
jgi:hypothetical protein